MADGPDKTGTVLIVVAVLAVAALVAGWYTLSADDGKVVVEGDAGEVAEDLEKAGKGLKKAGEATADAAGKVAEEVEKTDVDVDIERD